MTPAPEPRDSRPIRSIIIVGGGTAGWLSAAYLERALGDSVEILVIESSEIDPVGVGEATIPTLRNTFRFLGLEESKWMPRCNATYKIAIRFEGWARPPGSPGEDRFYHALFDRMPRNFQPYPAPFFPIIGEGVSMLQYCLQRHIEGSAAPSFAHLYSEGPAVCDAHRAPKPGVADEAAVPYAFHLDAGRLAGTLRDLAKERGVGHVVDHVVDVTRDEDGNIQTLHTRNGEFSADFFVDCTGFRGHLINGVMGAQRRSDTRHLLCDRAVAIPGAIDLRPGSIPPYTRARALQCGWSWDVPLFGRRGCGYVYSSDFCSPEQAEAELRSRLDGIDPAAPANHLKMRVGINDRIWIGNCVAIGLSACFLEPLESTGIFFIEFQLANLLTHFPDRRLAGALSRQYNAIIHGMYEDIRDFIILHYYGSHRDDTEFWRAVREDATLTSTLAEKLEFLRESFPTWLDFTLSLFREASYACILAGLDRLPTRTIPLMSHVDHQKAAQLLEQTTTRAQQLAAELPDHFSMLERMREGAGV